MMFTRKLRFCLPDVCDALALRFAITAVDRENLNLFEVILTVNCISSWHKDTSRRYLGLRNLSEHYSKIDFFYSAIHSSVVCNPVITDGQVVWCVIGFSLYRVGLLGNFGNLALKEKGRVVSGRIYNA